MIRKLQNRPHWLEIIYAASRMLGPLRPWLKPDGWVGKFLSTPKNSAKALFDCKMCGQCVLHSTGMTCPMTCPKNLRNGPCGGVRVDGHCEIDPAMPCIWVSAWERSRQMPWYGAQIMNIQPPLNRQLQGTSAWINDSSGITASGGVGLMTDFAPKADSRLERVLRSGRFAVTAELNPPDSADPHAVYERALVLASVCDGINATDASGAHVHMSSVAVCALLTRAGYEPVLQVSCRDRNRIAIQGDLLGAAALGVRNVLCLTGDGVQAGDQPEAKAVFDLDSISLLRTARVLRDRSEFLSGRKLECPPRLFLGAAENPFVPPYDFRALRLAKKVEAGADFIQTQFCFDVPRLQQFMRVYEIWDFTNACSSSSELGR